MTGNQPEQQQISSMHESNHGEPPSTPEQSRDTFAEESPANQQDRHQRKNRHPSGSVSLDFKGTDNAEASSSPYSTNLVPESEHTGGTTLASVNEDNLSESDGSTVMSMDDATGRSLSSAQSDTSSSCSNPQLDRSLRQDTEVAGTRGIEYDENGDLSMEFTNQEITEVFQPWVKRGSDRRDFHEL